MFREQTLVCTLSHLLCCGAPNWIGTLDSNRRWILKDLRTYAVTCVIAVCVIMRDSFAGRIGGRLDALVLEEPQLP